jgi:hypothetical protein
MAVPKIYKNWDELKKMGQKLERNRLKMAIFAKISALLIGTKTFLPF